MAAKLMLAILHLLEPRYNLWSQKLVSSATTISWKKTLRRKTSSFWILNLICFFKPFKIPPSPTHLTPCIFMKIKKSSVFCGFQIWVGSQPPFFFQDFSKSDRIFHSFHHGPVGPPGSLVATDRTDRGLKRQWCIVYKKVGMTTSLGLIGASYRWVVSGSRGSESWLLVDVGWWLGYVWMVGWRSEVEPLVFLCVCVAGRCVRFLFLKHQESHKEMVLWWLIQKTAKTPRLACCFATCCRNFTSLTCWGQKNKFWDGNPFLHKKYHLFFLGCRSWCQNHPKAVFEGWPWLPMVADFLVESFCWYG